PQLSPASGQVTHVLLTRPPRSAAEAAPVRLACIRHAASVVPEPGSNSPSSRPLSGQLLLPGSSNPILLCRLLHSRALDHASVVKVLRGILSRAERPSASPSNATVSIA